MRRPVVNEWAGDEDEEEATDEVASEGDAAEATEE